MRPDADGQPTWNTYVWTTVRSQTDTSLTGTTTAEPAHNRAYPVYPAGTGSISTRTIESVRARGRCFPVYNFRCYFGEDHAFSLKDWEVTPEVSPDTEARDYNELMGIQTGYYGNRRRKFFRSTY